MIFDMMSKKMLKIIQFYINKNDDKDNKLGSCGNDIQFNTGIKIKNMKPV
jgi:hypothetical protein